jgi:hypothetical protein
VTPYDYFRRTEGRFFPKTAAAALKAVDAGILPPEGYIYTATSVRPLDEEPYDIEEIERVLGRENLDIDSNILLMKIFERLLRSSEQEVALFAAEGINLIEGRYSAKIEKLKESMGSPRSPDMVRKLARLYEELSRLYEAGSSLRGFYLHEAYTWLTLIRSDPAFGNEDIIRFIRVLISLGLFDQAAKELHTRPAEGTTQLLLEAEIEFHRRRYSRVTEIFHDVQEKSATLADTERLLLEQWLGPDGR